MSFLVSGLATSPGRTRKNVVAASCLPNMSSEFKSWARRAYSRCNELLAGAAGVMAGVFVEAGFSPSPQANAIGAIKAKTAQQDDLPMLYLPGLHPNEAARHKRTEIAEKCYTRSTLQTNTAALEQQRSYVLGS